MFAAFFGALGPSFVGVEHGLTFDELAGADEHRNQAPPAVIEIETIEGLLESSIG